MKNSKKALAIILCAVLICSLLSASAFAATVTPTGDTSKAVTGTYAAGSEAATVYSVGIAWGSMAFTYTAASEGTWNPTTMTYEGVTEGAWSCEADANKITVTNKSNAPVYAGFAFTDAVEPVEITGAFFNETGFTNSTPASVAIAAATPGTEGNNGTATVADTYLKLTGALPSTGFASAATIGTITITILDTAS